MSAAELRAAAALMRTRAEAATPGPWGRSGDDLWMVANGTLTALTASHDVTADAEHIASWHPAVALAVADWLDAVAGRWQNTFTATDEGSKIIERQHHALIVARAYLGGDT